MNSESTPAACALHRAHTRTHACAQGAVSQDVVGQDVVSQDVVSQDVVSQDVVGQDVVGHWLLCTNSATASAAATHPLIRGTSLHAGHCG